MFAEDGKELRLGLESCRHRLPGFSFGIGRNLEQADRRLRIEKAYRVRIGLRAHRGHKPSWMRQSSALLVHHK